MITVAAFDALWVAGCPNRRPTGSCPESTVVRLDPTTLEVTKRVRVDGNVTALAADQDAMWLGQWTYVNNEPQPGYVFRLDPDTLALRRYSLEALRRKRPPCCVRGLAPGEGAVWLMYGDWAQLVRMDPDTGRLTQLRAYGSDLGAGEGAVWLVGRTHRRAPEIEGTLRFDPLTNDLTAVGAVAASVTAASGQVWVVEKSWNPNDRTLTIERLDPATGSATGPPITVEAGRPKLDFECGGCGWVVRITYGEGTSGSRSRRLSRSSGSPHRDLTAA